MPFSPRFLFCFIAFLGVSQREEFKNTTKKSRREGLTNKPTKTPKPGFSRFFCNRNRVFGRYSELGEGSSKTPQNTKK
jgi:hypothetical protein